MKKLFTILSIVALAFTACEGDPGPEGPPGLDGTALVGSTYETPAIDFSVDNDFYRFTFPSNIVNGDAVLVYRLEDVVDGLDVWEPLPTATIFFDDGGFLQYRFNYTLGDVDIILESDDISLAGAEFTQDQIFRIVVVPSDLVAEFNGDFSNYYEVMSALELNETNIQTLK